MLPAAPIDRWLMEAAIRENLEQTFQLPSDAVNFLCDLFSAIQLFDDVADDDPVQRGDLDRDWETLNV